MAQRRNEYIVEVTCCSLHRVESGDAAEAACRLMAGVVASSAAVCVLVAAASTHFANTARSASPVLEEVVSATSDPVEPS